MHRKVLLKLPVAVRGCVDSDTDTGMEWRPERRRVMLTTPSSSETVRLVKANEISTSINKLT